MHQLKGMLTVLHMLFLIMITKLPFKMFKITCVLEIFRKNIP